MNRGLFCGASVLTVAFFTTALASSAQAAAAPAATPSASEVGEVVVTAEKRSTKLEKTPVAVTALTSQMRDLQGISSVQDMTDVTPGLSYNTLANRPFMRGVGRQTDDLASDSAVAVYSDGVYGGSNASTILQLDSLFTDRVDVLRGPQSTLFGRSADGGMMNYISKKPTNEFYAEGRVGADNYSKYYGEAVVSGPITDYLKFRVGGSYASETGGYYRNLDGPPEGGNIAQGGNGTSYHAEVQLQGNIGDKFDAWAKVGTSDYSVSYRASVLNGPYINSEFGGGSPSALGGTYFGSGSTLPTALYAMCDPKLASSLVDTYCPGSTVLGIATPGTGAAHSPNQDTIVPGSTVLGPYSPLTNNINANNIRLFDNSTTSDGTSTEGKDLILATTLTYHFPTMDLKYTGGYQSFYYNLEPPSPTTPSVDVLSYALAGPATANASCLSAFPTNIAGCTQNLTIYPSQAHTAFIEKEDFFSHELNLSSTDKGPVQWVAGLYWYHENYNQPVDVIYPNQPQLFAPYQFPLTNGLAAPNPLGCYYCTDTSLTADDYAGFGQVDWQVDDQWKLTAGLRYTADHKFGWQSYRIVLFDSSSFGNAGKYGANTPAVDYTPISMESIGGPNFPNPGSGPLLCTNGSPYMTNPGTSSATPTACAWSGGFAFRQLGAWWGAVTGTAGVTWTPTPDFMGYLRYSRGSKNGGFESYPIINNPLINQETVDSYELGFKEVYAHALTVNAAIFYSNYVDMQVPLTVVPAAVGGVQAPSYAATFNIPTSRMYGVELEATWKPVNALLVNASYTYLNTAVTSVAGNCFVDGIDPYAQAVGANHTGCAVVGGQQPQNLTGEQLPLSSPNKISLNAIYTFKFEPGNLALSGTYLWRDGSYSSLFNRAYYHTPAYSEVNVRATWTDAKDRYTVFVFANNLFNTVAADGTGAYLIQATPTAPPVVEKTSSLIAPTTYGIEFQYRFR